ncbi:unnamed protein product [Cladocopium goreaui]|uniref:Ubiquitin-like protease family profile domain-containing protein n=1 Tax=Cladocopium goreaui TaxID=2562237 RepID=A0A9P1FJ87_9DINO|nr:unnamed protein product [Cladocopium goreaui]
MKGILIVPGAHASLDNISAAGEWVEDDVFTYMGQTRKHPRQGWQSIGRMEKDQGIRSAFVQAFLGIQPAGIEHGWHYFELGHQGHGQGASSGITSKRLFLSCVFIRGDEHAHEASCSVMAKMTAAMQPTDIDFSHQFKSPIREQVNECNRKGTEAIRSDPAAPSEIYKMSLKDVASCIDHAMQIMIDKNHEDNWVLAGMRRNGFLAVRPDENGHLKWCGDQSWCASMPLGSSRIPASWLENRLADIQQDGAHVPEPIWNRMSGATELADLIEWSYHQQEHANADMDINIEAADEACQDRRDKMREKRKQRKIRMEAKKQITHEEREKINQDLQSKSRYEAMMSIVPSAKTLKPSVLKKNKLKNKLKSTKEGITDQKKGKKQLLKNQKRKAAAQALKDKKAADENADSHEKLPPLPPPPDAPPSDTPAISEELLKGTFRIVSDEASHALYGRQGSVMSIGNEKYQLLLQKKKAQQKEQLTWAPLAQLHEIDENLPVWAWQQISLSRYLRSEILKDSGTISPDVTTFPAWDAVEILQEKILPAGGLEAQSIICAYHFLCTTLNKKQSGAYSGFHMISPILPASARLQMHEGIDSEKTLKAFRHKMSNKNQVHLFPLNSAQHWALMVLDLPQKGIRYYDSINGDMNEGCLALAEIMLGYLMEHDIINGDMFLDHPGITRSNSVRQPLQSNICGHDVLAFMEEEMCRSEYGPAATEHPSAAASAWHSSRLAKLTQALQVELEKMKIEIVSEHQKLEAQGEKLHKERMKQYELAKKRLSQGHELTALMEEAYQQIHEHKKLGITGNQLHEDPAAMEIAASEDDIEPAEPDAPAEPDSEPW